jgi:hypothetical protein
MTLADALARPRPRDAGHPSPMSLWRLLWLELRRNAMPWMFPLLAALFVFDPYRTAMSYPPLWDLHASVVVNKLLPDFVAFVAGVAAWMGSRDSRRHTADLVTATARPRWAAWLVTWAATTIWAVILYLCGVAAGGAAVCVHPAYRAYLPQVTAAFTPVLREISGLSGAPARITEVGDLGLSTTPGTITGMPPEFTFGMPSTVGSFGQTKSGFAGSLQVALVTAFIPGDGAASGKPGGSGSPGSGPPPGAVPPAVQARQAVQEGLLLAAGFRLPARLPQLYAYAWPGTLPTPQARAVAERFAALPAATRRAWLAAHLTALRAGHINLAQLP